MRHSIEILAKGRKGAGKMLVLNYFRQAMGALGVGATIVEGDRLVFLLDDHNRARLAKIASVVIGMVENERVVVGEPPGVFDGRVRDVPGRKWQKRRLGHASAPWVDDPQASNPAYRDKWANFYAFSTVPIDGVSEGRATEGEEQAQQVPSRKPQAGPDDVISPDQEHE